MTAAGPGLLAAGEAHVYISTACLHGRHEQCGVRQLGRGDLGPPHCKYCPAVCACPACSHAEQGERERTLLHVTRAVRRPGSAP